MFERVDRTSTEESALHLSDDNDAEMIEGLDTGAPMRGGKGFARIMARYGLLLVLILMVLVFGLMEPDSFLTIANLRTTASIAMPLLVLAIALTVPLSLGEFDLSISANTQLSGAVVIWSISKQGWSMPLAIVITVVVASSVGTAIGAVVVKSGVNAFIVTLGAGTVLTGLEFGVSRGSTIYSDIPSGYADIANGRWWGVPIGVFVALTFGLIIWALMERTVTGRQMRAVGGNSEAARLSGVRVAFLRVLGFTTTGVGAAVAAVLLTSQSASYYPNSASALLLSVYAACFLGTTVFRQNIFQVGGTIVGVAFLATLQSGLIMVGVETWIGDIVKGMLLIGAVTLSKLVSRGAT